MYNGKKDDRNLRIFVTAGITWSIIIAGFNAIKIKNNNKQNVITNIPEKYSHVEDFYKYVNNNGNAVKMYVGGNTYILYDKNTLEPSLYLCNAGLGSVELYDLNTEQILAYADRTGTSYNGDYFQKLINNNYTVCLSETGNYINGYEGKEYYTLEEIYELEPLIQEEIKSNNESMSR